MFKRNFCATKYAKTRYFVFSFIYKAIKKNHVDYVLYYCNEFFIFIHPHNKTLISIQLTEKRKMDLPENEFLFYYEKEKKVNEFEIFELRGNGNQFM